MPKLLDLAFGILMTFCGWVCFGSMPKLAAKLAELHASGKLTTDEVRKKKKIIKLPGFCSAFVGCGLILSYIFGLKD